MVSTRYNVTKNAPRRPIVCKKGPPPANDTLILILTVTAGAPNRKYGWTAIIGSAVVQACHLHVHSSISTSGPVDFDANVGSPSTTTGGFKIGTNTTATCQATATWADGTTLQVTESITIP